MSGPRCPTTRQTYSHILIAILDPYIFLHHITKKETTMNINFKVNHVDSCQHKEIQLIGNLFNKSSRAVASDNEL